MNNLLLQQIFWLTKQVKPPLPHVVLAQALDARPLGHCVRVIIAVSTVNHDTANVADDKEQDN
jgi:hypothetical protein